MINTKKFVLISFMLMTFMQAGDKDGSAILLASKNSYQDNTFFDGTPFGMKEEG